MKKLIIFLLIVTPIFSYSQSKNIEWDYSEYWERLKSINSQAPYHEKLKDCQIPERLLNEMTTEALVKTCLNFPFLLDIYAFENNQEGFDKLTANFNGLNELYLRDDAATSILKIYRKINYEHMSQPHLLDNKYKDKRGKFVIELDYIELFLAQDQIISKLTKSEKLLLAKECIKKHDEKCKNNNLYGIANIHSTVLILGRLLQLEDEYLFKDDELNTTEFIKKGELKRIENFTEIIKNAKSYVSK